MVFSELFQQLGNGKRRNFIIMADIYYTVFLMGKLELPPFDSPEAETEIRAGALMEYSGRGLAMFKLGKSIELIVGVTLVASFYLGGLNGPLPFLLKTLSVLLLMSILQTLLTHLRIDQTVGLWWRFGAILVLAQILLIIFLRSYQL